MPKLSDLIPEDERYEKEARESEHEEGAASRLLEIKQKNMIVKDQKISLRVNSELYRQFKEICYAKDRSAAAELSAMMKSYVAENRQYLD